MTYVKRANEKDVPHVQIDDKFQQRDKNQQKNSCINVINKYVASKVTVYRDEEFY